MNGTVEMPIDNESCIVTTEIWWGTGAGLQVDGYCGHHRLRREDRPGGPLTLASCWVYVAAGMMLRRAGTGVQGLKILDIPAT